MLVDDFPLLLSHSFTGISERGFVVDNRLLGGGEVVVRGGEVVDKRLLRGVSCDLGASSTTFFAESAGGSVVAGGITRGDRAVEGVLV